MPYINTKLNVKLPQDKEVSIKEKFGQAIALVPGKSENHLMLGFEDSCRMYFKGNGDQPMAFVEVKCFGKSSKDAYNKLTSKITQILNDELSIAADHIYVKYEECEYWGWNGSNF